MLTASSATPNIGAITARIAGTDGVYVLHGFSRFLYERDTKGFRELKVVEVPADQTTKVTIENEHGTFELSKDGESWAGTLKNKPMKEFESSKADDLVRAFATVNATAFGDAETLASAGLETPAATITFGRADGGETKILFGGQTQGTARFAKLPEGAQIYALSSWVSDWAFANEEKFQKKEGEDEAAAPPGGMPPGMGMPGMPMGMPPH